MSNASAFLLGIIQGITEWIPVSSQGVVALAATWIDEASPSDAIAIGLWLHGGTALSAVIAMRREVTSVMRDSMGAPLRFLGISTAVTAVVGVPVYFLLGELADLLGGAAMLVVGVAMLATAFIIRCGLWEGERGRDDVTLADAVIAGVAQALAVIPGLSRTGLTVAVLLARDCSHREAVVLSVLMGIPASIGAGVLAASTSDTIGGWPAVVAVVTAAAVGAVVIRAILAWASRVTLAPFVAAAGIAITAGALITLLA